MKRRADTKTAELVEIALLTRAAFEQNRAVRYASIAGLPLELIDNVFSRPPGAARSSGTGSATSTSDRRRVARD